MIRVTRILSVQIVASLFFATPSISQDSFCAAKSTARLAYSEEVGQTTDEKEVDCAEGFINAGLDCVASHIDSVGQGETIKEYASASVTYSVSTDLIELDDGDYLLGLDPVAGQPTFINKMPISSVRKVRADALLVTERLRAWRYRLNAEEVDQLKSGTPVSVSLERPFEGLEKLVLTEPVVVFTCDLESAADEEYSEGET